MKFSKKETQTECNCYKMDVDTQC